MRRAFWQAAAGSIALLAMLALLQTALFPLPWLSPAASLLLPPGCLFPALYYAGKRRRQLRHAARLHQAEQKRLMLACRMLHTRADALSEERRQLQAQIDELQALAPLRALTRETGDAS